MMDESGERRAAKLYQQGQFTDAAATYSECLETSIQIDPGRRIHLLLSRSACYIKLKNHDAALEDYDEVLEIDELNIKAQLKKIKTLSSTGKFVDALDSAKKWLECDPENAQAQHEVERLGIVVKALLDQSDEEDDDNDVIVFDHQMEHLLDNHENELKLKSPVITEQQSDDISELVQDAEKPNGNSDDQQAIDTSPDSSIELACIDDDNDEDVKCMTENDAEFPNLINSTITESKLDCIDGRTWKFREPPRGLTSDEFQKCPSYMTGGICRFGDKCTEAHSDEELLEWRERFDYRRQQLQENNVYSSFSEQLLEKWMNADNPEMIMSSNPPGIKLYCNSDFSITMATKRCNHAWLFTLTSKLYLSRVVLLDESKRHFNITSVTIGPKKNQKSQKLDESCQEWLNPVDQRDISKNETVYRVKLLFRTDIFGTFRQTVVFDFGVEPVMCQQLCVDSSPVIDVDKLEAELTLSEKGRWEVSSIPVVEYLPKRPCSRQDAELMEKYPIPSASQIANCHCLQDGATSKENYRDRMHSLLYIEEMAQYSNISKYNVKTWLDITNRFMLMPSTYSTAKYAQNGELFAHTNLATDISEDTAHGRLILQNVNRVLIAPADKTNKSENKTPAKLYEAILEEKGKDFVYMRLSAQCVQDLDLKADKRVYVQVQFQLNRLPLCEMHSAIDKLPDSSMIFPDLTKMIKIPWNPQKQWQDKFDKKLNAKQREAIVAITTTLTCKLPPILITGPYGTGKTFALAQASRELVRQPNTRILICTHSNSAADLYIKDYLHGYVEDGFLEARPLRVMYEGRWIQTVSPTILEYCMLDPKSHNTQFRCPTIEDLQKHRIIVTTLSSSRMLYNIGLDKDFFTHILLDEAAQAMELETIMPMALAGDNTRIVLAGDHVQMSPEVHSEFARQHGLHISLLERLYDMFPKTNACKILLCENYRSHKAIIEFTSDLFYDNNLVTSGSQPRHEVFYPLSFFTARGEDVQHQNSTGFYNNAEVYEIAERVAYVQKMWPKTWGPFNENSIGVVSPYADQVVRIRAELRKRKLGSVSVERVFNVQGKQFRAIFLSTVRTRHTCCIENADDEIDYGFLSNVKLLNTAITRAQSLVAVVGDPVSVCTIGKCRKVWETFIETCHKNNSLYGITWSQLRSQIDGIELKKTYVLNPLAPEFIPNRLRHGPPLQQAPFGTCTTPQFNQAASRNMMHNKAMPFMQPFLPQFQMCPQPVGFGYYGVAPWYSRFPHIMAQYPGMNSRAIRPGISMPIEPLGFPILMPPSYMPQQFPSPIPSDHYTVVSVSRPGSIGTLGNNIQRKRTNSGGNIQSIKSDILPTTRPSWPRTPTPTVMAPLKISQNCPYNQSTTKLMTTASQIEGQRRASDTVIINPYLQQEFYSYILQKEGQIAANRFLEKLRMSSYEGQPYIRNDIAAGNVAKDQRNATVSVNRRQRSMSQSSADGDSRIHCWNKVKIQSLSNTAKPVHVSKPQQQCKTSVNSSSTQTELITAGAAAGGGNNNSNNDNRIKKAENFNKNATVNVGTVLGTKAQQHRGDIRSEYLMNDPDAPIAVDQVVRFLEDSIDSDESDDGMTPTYAGVLGQQGRDSSRSPQDVTYKFTEKGVISLTEQQKLLSTSDSQNSLLHSSFLLSNQAMQPPYSSGNILISNPDRALTNRVHQQHRAASVIGNISGGQTTTTNGGLRRILRHQMVSPSPDAELQDPLELLKNLNIKASPGTQAFYQYFS